MWYLGVKCLLDLTLFVISSNSSTLSYILNSSKYPWKDLAYKYEEDQEIANTATIIIEIFNDVVIVQDEENNKFEVYMNNIIKPSEG